MQMLLTVGAVLGALAAGLYTLNYARWCQRRELRVGAAGLAVLAAAVVALPLWILFFR